MAKRKPKTTPASATPAEIEVGLTDAPVVAAAASEPVPVPRAEDDGSMAPSGLTTATPPAAEPGSLPADASGPDVGHADRHAQGPTVANPFVIRADYAAGVRLAEDRRYRQMQIRFDEKPSDEVRYEIGDVGYRWRSAEGCWTKQLDPAKAWQTRAEADELFERVAAMIRDEKGVGRQP